MEERKRKTDREKDRQTKRRGEGEKKEPQT